ncbi:lipase secretion chaperone, partial [Pseudomonas aeruginosa]
FTLERLAIRQDGKLSAEEKAAAIDRLRASLPEDQQESVLPQLQSELQQQTAALQAGGGFGAHQLLTHLADGFRAGASG